MNNYEKNKILYTLRVILIDRIFDPRVISEIKNFLEKNITQITAEELEEFYYNDLFRKVILNELKNKEQIEKMMKEYEDKKFFGDWKNFKSAIERKLVDTEPVGRFLVERFYKENGYYFVKVKDFDDKVFVLVEEDEVKTGISKLVDVYCVKRKENEKYYFCYYETGLVKLNEIDFNKIKNEEIREKIISIVENVIDLFSKF